MAIHLRNSLKTFTTNDCMDAGGTEPWMVKLDCAGSKQSRATQGAVAETRRKKNKFLLR